VILGDLNVQLIKIATHLNVYMYYNSNRFFLLQNLSPGGQSRPCRVGRVVAVGGEGVRKGGG
jgi:hypothetical protein